MSFLDNLEEHAFEQGRSVAIEGFTTPEILTELKKRYRKEMSILDYIEMIECEL